MRLLGHSKQVLSHVPIAATLATCTRFNDTLNSVVQMNSDKFAALATLPPEGKDAAKELQRCVTKTGFVGGVVALKPDGKGGLMLGEGNMEEVWSTAAKLKVPIMLRDMWPIGASVRSLHDLEDDEADLDTKYSFQCTKSISQTTFSRL